MSTTWGILNIPGEMGPFDLQVTVSSWKYLLIMKWLLKTMLRWFSDRSNRWWNSNSANCPSRETRPQPLLFLMGSMTPPQERLSPCLPSHEPFPQKANENHVSLFFLATVESVVGTYNPGCNINRVGFSMEEDGNGITVSSPLQSVTDSKHSTPQS